MKSSFFFKGAVAGFAAALLAWTTPASAQEHAATWQANDDDAVLLQMRVGNYLMQGDLRGYQTPGGLCLDLADVVQALDLPVRLDKKSRRATGWLFAEDQRLLIDREAGTVQTMNKTVKLASGQIHDSPEGWCADTAALSDWFGVSITPDMRNSLVTLSSEKPLPFIAALERKSRAARLGPRASFDLANQPHQNTPYRAWRMPSVDVVAQMRLDTRPGQITRTEARYELFASGELLGASVTARLASDRRGIPDSLRLRAFRIDPEAGLLGPLRAREAAIGDVESVSTNLVSQTAVGRGLFVSNRPLNRPTRFATTALRGTLPAGWDAELYRDGQLLAFQDSRADGRYEFLDIELLYGPNLLEVVLYGPQGQIRRERTAVPIGGESIAPGKTWYWASALQQDTDVIDLGRVSAFGDRSWRWGAGVEHGFDTRTSASLAAHSLTVFGRRHDYLEGTLRRALGPALLEFSGAQQRGGGRALRLDAIGKLGSVNFQAETLFIDGDFESDYVRNGQRREYRLRADISLKLNGKSIPVQAALRRATRADGGSITEWQLRASLNSRRVAVTAELGHVATTGPAAFNEDDGTRAHLLANTQLGKIRLRGDAEFRMTGPKRGLYSAGIVTERQLTVRSDVRATFDYYRQGKRAEFGLGYLRQFDRFAVQADGLIGLDGTVGAGLSIALSLGPDPRDGTVRFSSKKLARTGLADVTVFVDEDGDGRRSAGESLLPDVGVQAGLRTTDAVTDGAGRALVDGLRPYAPILVGIDIGSLPDPMLIPQSRGVVVIPRPGVPATIELAVSPTGEVEGVLNGTNGVPIEGVLLELVNARGYTTNAVTEFDGFFLFEQVPYGQFSLRVAAKSADILKVVRILADDLTISKDQALQRTGVLQLHEDNMSRALAAADRL